MAASMVRRGVGGREGMNEGRVVERHQRVGREEQYLTLDSKLAANQCQWGKAVHSAWVSTSVHPGRF